MKIWWKAGFDHAKYKNDTTMSDFRPELIENKEVEKGLTESNLDEI